MPNYTHLKDMQTKNTEVVDILSDYHVHCLMTLISYMHTHTHTHIHYCVSVHVLPEDTLA